MELYITPIARSIRYFQSDPILPFMKTFYFLQFKKEFPIQYLFNHVTLC